MAKIDDVRPGTVTRVQAGDHETGAAELRAAARLCQASAPAYAVGLRDIAERLSAGAPAQSGPVKSAPDKAANILQLGQVYLATARAKDSKTDTQPQAPAFYAKASEMFHKGIEKFPDEIAFYQWYADVAVRSGQLGDTETVLKNLAARDAWKGKIEPQLLLAEYYGIAGRLDDAHKMYDEILAKDAKNKLKRAGLA